jgi:D-xylose transport system permease protein
VAWRGPRRTRLPLVETDPLGAKRAIREEVTHAVTERTRSKVVSSPLARLVDAARRIRRAELDARLLGMLTAWVVIALVFDTASEGLFLTARNLYNLSVQTSVVGVMACGMMLVIAARHIDLSVGSLLGFTGMSIAVLQVEVFPVDAAWSWPASVVLGLALGAAIGLWQGWWVAYRGLPAFVVTLAGLLIFRGSAYLLTDGRTVAPLDPSFQMLGGGLSGSLGARWSWLLGAAAIAGIALLQRSARRSRVQHGFAPRPMWAEWLRWLAGAAAVAGFVAVMNAHTQPRSEIARGIPIPVLLLIATALLTTLLARATRFGRYVFAIGGNPEAALLVGVDVRRVTLGIFALMGLLSALAAVIATARLGAGVNSLGTLTELSVIAAAVIGGSSLAGGAGTVAGAVLGAFIMQSLENGMVLLGVSSAMRQVGIGFVLMGAVWLDGVYQRRRLSQ